MQITELNNNISGNDPRIAPNAQPREGGNSARTVQYQQGAQHPVRDRYSRCPILGTLQSVQSIVVKLKDRLIKYVFPILALEVGYSGLGLIRTVDLAITNACSSYRDSDDAGSIDLCKSRVNFMMDDCVIARAQFAAFILCAYGTVKIASAIKEDCKDLAGIARNYLSHND